MNGSFARSMKSGAVAAVMITVTGCSDSPTSAFGGADDGPEIRAGTLPSLEAIDLALLGGARIAFQRFHPGSEATGVYLVDGRTGTVTTHLGGTVLSAPVVSPNGDEIAFTALTPFVPGQDPTLWDVYVTRLDGSQRRQISSFPRNEGPPGWSPQGKVLFSHAPSLSVVYIYEQSPVQGPGDRRLVHRFASQGGTAWRFSDQSPSADPDGRIAIAAGGMDNAGIHIFDPAGGEITRVHEAEDRWWPRTAAFSPDGNRIAFLETRRSQTSSAKQTRVSALELETGDVRVLGVIEGTFGSSLGPGTDFSLCWTHDGARIVFTATTTGHLQSHVHVVPADGSAPLERLTAAPNVVDRSVSCPRGS